MEKLVDIHTHRKGSGIYIFNSGTEAGCPGGEDAYCSLGIHPLFFPSDPENRLADIALAAEKKAIVAVGEAGLDRNSVIPLPLQLKWLERQVELSEQEGLPLILHCVRAFPELISLYKKRAPLQAWIIHGYNNRREILAELLRHGFYISAGKNLFVPGSNIRCLLGEIPPDRLLMETDDSSYSIEEIYEEAARLLGLEVPALARTVYINFQRIFKI